MRLLHCLKTPRSRGLWLAAGLTLSLVPGPAAAELQVSSPQMPAGGTLQDEQVFNGFGCTGKNVSPAISWSQAPKGTKSFAVTLYDPDAPTGSGWWHWVVFNIPATAQGLPKNAGDPQAGLLPAGSVQSRTDFGQPGYGGPCPPVGNPPHRYQLTVYALDTAKLDLDTQAPAAMVGFFLHQHLLGKTVIEARYGR